MSEVETEPKLSFFRSLSKTARHQHELDLEVYKMNAALKNPTISVDELKQILQRASSVYYNLGYAEEEMNTRARLEKITQTVNELMNEKINQHRASLEEEFSNHWSPIYEQLKTESFYGMRYSVHSVENDEFKKFDYEKCSKLYNELLNYLSEKGKELLQAWSFGFHENELKEISQWLIELKAKAEEFRREEEEHNLLRKRAEPFLLQSQERSKEVQTMRTDIESMLKEKTAELEKFLTEKVKDAEKHMHPLMSDKEMSILGKGNRHHIDSVDDDLTVNEMKAILEGKMPLFYYHGTKTADVVIASGKLVPNARLEFAKKIMEYRRLNNREEMKKAFEEMKNELESAMHKYKLAVVFKNRMQYKDLFEALRDFIKISDEDRQNIIEKFSKYNDINQYFSYYFSLKLDRVSDVVSSSSGTDMLNILLSEKWRHIYRTVIEGQQPLWIGGFFGMKTYKDLADLEADILKEKEKTFKEMYNEGESHRIPKQRMNEYLDLVWDALNYSILTRVKYKIIEDVSNQIYCNFGLTSLYKDRDKWFVFFGADQPYPANEKFWNTVLYAGGLFGLMATERIEFYEHSAVFEIKPSFYKYVLWSNVQPKKQEESNEFMQYAPEQGRLTHDIITTKFVPISNWVSRIYTIADMQDVQPAIDTFIEQKRMPENESPYTTINQSYDPISQEVQKACLNIPVLRTNEQPKIFSKAMEEIRRVYEKHKDELILPSIRSQLIGRELENARKDIRQEVEDEEEKARLETRSQLEEQEHAEEQARKEIHGMIESGETDAREEIGQELENEEEQARQDIRKMIKKEN